MKNKITLQIEGFHSYQSDTSVKLNELVKSLDVKNVIAAKVNGELVDLNFVVDKDSKVELIDLSSRTGLKVYTSGLKFVLITAVKELYGLTSIVRTEHSFDKGIFCSININVELKEKDIENIKNKMKEIINESLPIEKINASTSSAIKYFESVKENEKSEYYETYVDETVTIYKLKKYFNYFYTIMPINTNALKYFDITFLKNNSFILQYPINNTEEVPLYVDRAKLLEEFSKYHKWTKLLNVPYVSKLNKLVSFSRIEEFIQLNEINQNSTIDKITDEIINDAKIKMVLIGGPSSSGKTTSANKFALYLKNKGLNPFIISVDDYYKDRVDSPKYPDGTYNFECLEALDIELFNAQLKDLIGGKETIMPKFNFKTGKKEFGEHKTKMNPNDIIIIEGLHTMNEELTKDIPREIKYKIYASPFTPLGIDRHNHISTADIRLLRRIVRDNVTRGYTPEHTLRNWEGVRKGEELYVFDHQVEADAVFNTILVYEIGVLRVFVEPLLHSINKSSKYYVEAKRLLSFLQSFFPIPESYVPKESILREFIGNSYFK